MDNEQKQIPKELKRKKLEAATLASSKFRDALESCEKLSKFDCFVDYDYGDYYVYTYDDGTQVYENLEYYDEQSETEDYENLEDYDEQSETQDYEHLQY